MVSVTPTSPVAGSLTSASFTASFSFGVPKSNNIPTGALQLNFQNGASRSPLCTIPLPTSLGGYQTSNGIASFTGSCSPTTNTLLSAGKNTIYASFGGSTVTSDYFQMSTSSGFSVTVSAAPATNTTATALQVSQGNLTYGSEGGEVFTGTITVNQNDLNNLGAPTGSLDIEYGATVLCGIPIPSSASGTWVPGPNGTASATGTCSPKASALPPGADLVTAFYAGDSSYQQVGAADMGTQTVTVANSDTVTLTLSPDAVAYGQESQVNLSADVQAPRGSTTQPSGGTVTFYEVPAANPAATPKAICSNVGLGGTDGTTAACNGLSNTQLPAASYSVYAQYSGSGAFPAATSKQETLTVNANAVDVYVSFSPAAVTYGQETAETVTATVVSGSMQPPAPAGYVELSSGSWSCNTGSLMSTGSTADSSSASCTIDSNTALPAGKDRITAQYVSSDGIYPDTSAANTLTVNPAATTTDLQLSQSSVTYGNEHVVLYTATVTGDPGLGVPTGAVTIENRDAGAAVVCTTAPLTKVTSDSASATCTSADTALAVGTYLHLDASYAQTGNYAASLSSDHALTVNAATPTVALQWNTGSTLGGDLVYSNEGATTLSATVTGAAGVGTYPGGTVDIYAQNTVTGKKALVCHITAGTTAGVTSTWTCNPADTVLQAGTYDIWAAYSGDSHYNAAGSSQQQTVTVDPAATTTTISGTNPNPVIYGTENGEQLSALVTNVTGSHAGATGTATQPSGTVSFYYAPGTNTASWTLLCTTGPLSGPGANEASATCSPSNPLALGVATYTAQDLVAVYAANGSFAGSNSQVTVSAPELLRVNAAPTGVKVTVTPASVTYGNEQSAVVNIGVTAGPTGNLSTPSGRVEVLANGPGAANVVLCPATELTGGRTTCSPTDPSALSGGNTFTITAKFLGSTDFSPSEGTTTLTVDPAATTTELRVSKPTGVNPSVAFASEATSLAFEVTVTGPTAGTAPLGSVTVYSGGNPSNPRGEVCTATLTAGTGAASTATCIPSDNGALDAGAYTSKDLYAVYTPANPSDDGNSSSYQSSAGTLLTVTSAATTTTVSVHSVRRPYPVVNPPAVAFGKESKVSFAVTVSSSDAFLAPWLGEVTLSTMANGNPVTLCTIGSASAFTFTHTGHLFFGNGYCTASDTALPAGSYTVTASYQDATGFSDYAPSSGTTPLTVTPDATTTVIDSMPQALTYGGEGTAVYTATVTNTTSSQTPTGTVTFTAGNSTICSGSLAPVVGHPNDAVVQCSPTATAVPVGTYYPDTPLMAAFTPSNGNFATSATPTNLGTPLLLKVSPAATSVGPVKASSAVVQYGNEDAEHYSAAVTSTAGTVDAGSVTFSANGHTLCTGTVTAGSASCSPSGEDTLLAVSTNPYNVTTSYSGGGNFASQANGGATQITVIKGSTSTSLSFGSPIVAGSEGAEKFAVTVSDKTGASVPTGTVTVVATSTTGANTTVCSNATLVGGQVVCGLSASELAAGDYDVTATYSGNGSYLGSTTLGPLVVNSVSSDSTGTPTGGVVGGGVVTGGGFTGGTTNVVTGGGVITPLFTGQVRVLQGAPTSATVPQDSSATYTAQLATTGNIGAVTYTTTGSSAQLHVSPQGVVTTTGSLAPGTYSVVGTVTDAEGNTGAWGFQLTVTATDVAGAQTVTKQVVLVPRVAVLSHNLVVRKVGKVSLFTRPRIKCTGSICKVTAWISQRQAHFVERHGKKVLVSRIVKLGTVTFTLGAGKIGKPRLDLNAAGRKAIGGANRANLPLRVVLHAVAKGGNEDARTVKVV